MTPVLTKPDNCDVCLRCMDKGDYYYNARPIRLDGICCYWCNEDYVQPERLRRALAVHYEKEKARLHISLDLPDDTSLP